MVETIQTDQSQATYDVEAPPTQNGELDGQLARKQPEPSRTEPGRYSLVIRCDRKRRAVTKKIKETWQHACEMKFTRGEYKITFPNSTDRDKILDFLKEE